MAITCHSVPVIRGKKFRYGNKMESILHLIIFLTFTVENGAAYGSSSISPQPEQIHISRTADQSEMMITWTTLAPASSSVVEYNFKGQPLTNVAKGNSKPYKTCGWKKRYIHIHRVKLKGLLPSTSYGYRCGGSDGWSAIYFFKTSKVGNQWSPSLAVYGDLGVGNAQSLSKLQTEVQNGDYDAVLHVGDFAYDMSHDESRVADAFMNQIETIAAYVPYMVCPGNHEFQCNFSNYRERFSMPGDNQGLFYSWNIGPAHIISFSTELYYFLQYGIEQLVNQYKWLQKDLEEANLPHNRSIRPWIITMGHRPMYCSNMVGDGCENHENEIRTGITSLKLFPLEELFYKHGVDLEIWAHEHSYERLFPVYNHKGCKYCHDKFKRDYGPWTAFRTLDYGYTRMKIHNFTHLYLEQVSIDKNNKVIDRVWIIKDKHGREAWASDDVVQGVPSDAGSLFKANSFKTMKNFNDIIEKYTNDLKSRNNPYK
ncbi:acid phosphatase type 7-like isoform X2 [Actinia tenebrosa]|uniref:Purple acid phosphatase n=1 Tax=Actinia tenebrosa TaxID=6105 RepID=A0A6P8HNA6_ACTTE|nr:acid phosphatase type 7-like isoform X2 [Actinia tenebrosa]